MLFSVKPNKSVAVYQRLMTPPAWVLSGVLLVTGCATPEAPDATPDAESDAVELNLPDPEVAEPDCNCEELLVPVAEENYFDRGVRALAARDYEQAKIYFERHRASGGSEAQREADVGIAFVTLMSETSLVSDEQGASGVDERAEVMILALAAVQTLEGRLEALNAINEALSKDLEKREEALKRLRELTLGQ